ncbi:MAG: PAS domain-containing protein [Deltaproteobacteria bacterium]|nr:PAS domain-containing protein [Deltaproteobacteria bacterium]
MGKKKETAIKKAGKTLLKVSKPKVVSPDDTIEEKDPMDEIQETSDPNSNGQEGIPIVGIGASAGGLEAFDKFFTAMPVDSGCAFVLVQHLDPSHKSMLTELIQRYTTMNVVEIQDGMNVKPNTVFVIPPNKYIAILNDKLHLIETPAPPSIKTPIDFFFKSLAQDRKDKAICIVLSGSGSEGAMGLRAIKDEGGMGMVQTPESSKYDGMPKSAISTNLADYVLAPEDMPKELVSYVEFSSGKVPLIALKHAATEIDKLQKVVILVRSQTGQDFSVYKPNMVMRRVERRMAINKIGNLSGYLRYMQQYPTEAQKLQKDLLIGVTSFFRDPKAFDAVRDKAIVELCKKKDPNTPLRIWVPGCSTGEEAFSLAMLCQQCLAKLKISLQVQIFGTDLDETAIGIARLGLYPKSIVGDVPLEILNRYFIQEDGSYRVRQDTRDIIVFAVHNVVSDPPFSRVDLVSCRNLLIYLNPDTQKRVIALFHYALARRGLLFLGTAETVGDQSTDFSIVDRKWKLYRRLESACPDKTLLLSTSDQLAADNLITSRGHEPVKMIKRQGFRELAEKTLLGSFSPCAIIIRENSEILYVHGRSGKYLEIAPGEANLNLLAMAREGLRFELASAIRKAVTEDKEVRQERLRVKTNGDEQVINLIVRPLLKDAAMKRLLMVVFEDVPIDETTRRRKRKSASIQDSESPCIPELEQDLKSTKEYLQSVLSEKDAYSEELRSLTEEFQSSNEELQSANEELLTSKEELQSVNEELITVNAELEQKIGESTREVNDMQNLLASTGIGTLYLDSNLNIRRFTPSMTEFINLIKGDIGRPISHIVSKTQYDRLFEDATEVLRTLVPKQMEIQTNDVQWYTIRIGPYRTFDNIIDGVVVTFNDVTKLKVTEGRALAAQKLAESVLDTVRAPLMVLDNNLKVVSANLSFYREFAATKEATEGKSLFELDNKAWDIPEFRNLLERILPEKKAIDDFIVEHDFGKTGTRKLILNARQVLDVNEKKETILVSFEDVCKDGIK